MDRNILYYGSSAPLPERIPLRAGPLHLIYEQGDLRSICLGEHEILRRVYVAIRDRNWATIAPVFSNVDLRVEPDCFAITFDVENRAGEIDFAWHGVIRGEADGTITFQMDGAARKTFEKNRIGFCVLHPAGLSGQAAQVTHLDGTREETRFPIDVCADQPVLPFANLGAIRQQMIPGIWAEVTFSGDIFEMEDQRLWTDASYKTFCTPLSLPYPARIQAGKRVAQQVTLKLIDERSASVRQASAAGNAVSGNQARGLIQAPGDWRPMLALGVAFAGHGEALNEREAAHLRALHLHHLRVEMRLSERDYPHRFQEAITQAGLLGIPLEAALAVDSAAPEAALSGFRRLVDALRPKVCCWLVFPEHEPYTGGNPSENIARAAYKLLKTYDPSVPLAVGTNTDFIFLKRARLPLEWMDQVCITLNPQVHAFDNPSIVETLEAQPMLIESARRLAKGLPVVVSPVTLKPRFNPYAAAGLQPLPAPGDLPAPVDPRQLSLFGAGWTLGSLRAMVQGGAARVTYYETTGWQGVMEKGEGSLLPDRFPSTPGMVYPLYYVLAAYGEFAGGQACALTTSDPLKVSALALRDSGRIRYLVANHTPDPLAVSLSGCDGLYRERSLDETNAEAALRDPEAFHRDSGQRIGAEAGLLPITMQPYGITWLDRIQTT